MAEDLTLPSGVYRVGKFQNAVAQLQIARKLGPVFVKLGPLVEALQRMFPAPGEAAVDDVDLPSLLKDLEPFVQGLADLPDDQFEYIVNGCLNVVQRQSGAGGGFAPVRVNGQQMFVDIGPSDIMQLVFAVIKENLGNFMPAPSSISR